MYLLFATFTIFLRMNARVEAEWISYVLHALMSKDSPFTGRLAQNANSSHTAVALLSILTEELNHLALDIVDRIITDGILIIVGISEWKKGSAENFVEAQVLRTSMKSLSLRKK